MLIFLLAAAAFGAQEAPPPPDRDESEIVITGDRPKRDPRGGVERPYPETERVPLGSRIARRMERRPFRSVATDSGLAGMIGNSGESNWDGTGGSGHGVRRRLVTECVANHDQVDEDVACILFRVGTYTDASDYDSAAEALAPLLERRHLTSWERYYVGHYAYALAEARQDDGAREHALHLMLASGRMAEVDRRQALRSMAAMALRNGDYPQAISRLESLAELGPDPLSLANLAALYERAGRGAEARRRMAEAVEFARASGETPPEEWTAFIARPN